MHCGLRSNLLEKILTVYIRAPDLLDWVISGSKLRLFLLTPHIRPPCMGIWDGALSSCLLLWLH